MDEDEAAAGEAVALDIPAAVAVAKESLVEEPGAFLTGVSAALKAMDDVDDELAAILSNHLLTATPHANVIANAKAAILALAAKRVASTKEQTDG